MCYKVITHTLMCDVRPVLCDGHQIYVDPYSKPIPCNCNARPFIRARFACEDHACCMRIEKMVYCTREQPCFVSEYHRYEQKRCSNVWGINRTMQGDNYWADANTFLPAWPELPIFDDGTNLHTGDLSVTVRSESDHFLRARLNVLTTGRLIASIVVTLEEAHERLVNFRERHSVLHGSCERVLNPWECKVIPPIQELDGVVHGLRHTLERQMNLFCANMEFYNEVRIAERSDERQNLDPIVEGPASVQSPSDALAERLERMTFYLSPPSPSDTHLFFNPATIETDSAPVREETESDISTENGIPTPVSEETESDISTESGILTPGSEETEDDMDRWHQGVIAELELLIRDHDAAIPEGSVYNTDFHSAFLERWFREWRPESPGNGDIPAQEGESS